MLTGEEMVKADFQRKKTKIWFSIICITIIAFLILPIIGTMCYALPSADDFSFSNDLRRAGGHNFHGIMTVVKDNYLGWQGSFFSTFSVTFLDSFHSFGITGIKITLICIFLLFIFSIICFMKLYTNAIYDMPKEIVFFIILLLIAWCFNIRMAKQLFFWHTGACTYVIPLLFGFFGISCVVSYLKVKRYYYLVFCVIFGFLASGGSLQITGFICFGYMIILGICLLKKQNIKAMGLAFGFVLVGALLNALAPGNFARKSMSYEEISLVKAIYYSTVALWNEVIYIASETYYPFIMLIIAIIDFIYCKPIKDKLYHPLLVGCAIIASWLISTFPVCYGYGSSTLEQRGYLILDIYIVLGMFLFMNCLVNYLKIYRQITLSKSNLMICGMLIMLFLGYLQRDIPFSQIPSLQCLSQLKEGKIQECYKGWEQILCEIESSESEDVIIKIDNALLDDEVIIMYPSLSENPTKWVNVAVAEYYGKNSVRILREE